VDIFDKKQIVPMALHKSEPFNSADFYFELKYDGARCLAYLDNNQTTLISRNLRDMTAFFPELGGLNKNVNAKCILDGELVCFADGKPSLNLLLKRLNLTNAFRQKTVGSRAPACYVVFDILYINGKEITKLPLFERKSILTTTITENTLFTQAGYIEHGGVSFFEACRLNNLEGMVAKRKDSLYYPNKRSYDWLKVKVINN
jgi:ATP-dependent DNA ligase